MLYSTGNTAQCLVKLTTEKNLEIYIYNNFYVLYVGFPGGSMVKKTPANAGEMSLIPGSGRFPGREHGNPPVFLPGESHGERSLVGYSPYYGKESDTTEVIEHARMHFIYIHN